MYLHQDVTAMGPRKSGSQNPQLMEARSNHVVQVCQKHPVKRPYFFTVNTRASECRSGPGILNFLWQALDGEPVERPVEPVEGQPTPFPRVCLPG
jgi:hypothetical protein